MRRRGWLVAVAAWPLGACSAPPVRGFADMAAARQAIESVATGWRCNGSFTLAQMLGHAAQSVEYSMRGFPLARSALFRHTVGAAAFAVFDARGVMSHDLAQPIPDAPALAAADSTDIAVARLLKALQDFENHAAPLAPHFAYGALDKSQYRRAHLMHLANHWTQVVRA